MVVRSSSDFQTVSALPTLCSLQSECCRKLTCLLAAIGELKSLEKLVLMSCEKLESLPEGNQIDCAAHSAD